MGEKSKAVGIIGHFGGNEDLLDGQTVKTKILYEELKRASDWSIIRVDTYYKSKRPLRLLLSSLSCLARTRDVIVLLSGNGMRFYFPLLFLFARLFKTRVYHDVIGGNLDRYAEKYPRFRKYLNAFAVNWVETNGLKARLEKQGVENCEVMPNFKRLSIAGKPRTELSEPYSFCTFSRVMREKGIEDAVGAIEQLNRESGRQLCRLDIYGSVDSGYRDRFRELMRSVTGAVRFRGAVPYDKSAEALSGYDALLFPTHWDGEGFPGTIIDAFSAGIPVIATDWGSNAEIVCDGETGIIYPGARADDLKSAIRWLLEHRSEALAMRGSCIEAARLYQPDAYIERIIDRISDG